jgi:hypothetical protein
MDDELVPVSEVVFTSVSIPERRLQYASDSAGSDIAGVVIISISAPEEEVGRGRLFEQAITLGFAKAFLLKRAKAGVASLLGTGAGGLCSIINVNRYVTSIAFSDGR